MNRRPSSSEWHLSSSTMRQLLGVGFLSLSAAISTMSQQVSSWEFVGNPLGDSLVSKISVDPLSDSVFYVTGWNGLYVTRDRGGRWTRYLSGYTAGFSLDPGNPRRLFCGSNAKLYRSEDRGYSWEFLRDFPKYVQSVLVSAKDSAVYVGIRWENTPSDNGIYKSTDHGQTWVLHPYGVSARGLLPWDIEEDERTGMLYVGTEIYDHPTPYHPPFLRSSDGGTTWVDMSSMFSWHVIKIQADAKSQNIYALTENAGLYKSTNSGTSWRYLNNHFWLELLLDRRHSNRLFGGTHTYAGSGGGAFFSTDSGLTFGRVGLSGRIVSSLSLNGTSTELYAACYGSGIHRARVSLTDAEQENGTAREYAVHQNYPNPFNPTTTIMYELPAASDVSLTVFDLLGREVSRLVNDRQEAGVHRTTFDAAGLAGGVYFYRLRAGTFAGTRRLLVVR